MAFAVLRQIALVGLFASSALGIFRLPDTDESAYELLRNADNSRDASPSIQDYVMEGLDETADRCEDFYQYACGGILEKNRTGLIYTASTELYQNLFPIIRKNKMLNAFHQSCLALAKDSDPDVPAVFVDAIRQIEAATDMETLMTLIGDLARTTPVNLLLQAMQLFPFVDESGERRGALYVGIGVSQFKRSDLAHLPAYEADQILAVQSKLPAFTANVEEELLAKGAQPTTRSVKDLVDAFPKSWGPLLQAYFAGNDLSTLTIDRRLDDYDLQIMEGQFLSVPFSELRQFLAAKVRQSVMQLAPSLVGRENDFVQLVCLRFTMEHMSDLVGQEFMNKKFSAEAKAATKQLIDNVIVEAKEILKNEKSTLDQATRNDFASKVNKVNVHIGGKDQVKDYSGINFTTNAYIDNVMAISQLETARFIGNIGKAAQPLDVIEAAQVNAFYHGLWNDLFIPAGILQSPLFSIDFPKAIQYGVIGHVLAHELTHAVDPNSLRMDADGEFRPTWWVSEEGKEILGKNTKCFIDSYSKFKVYGENGKYLGNVNGDLTKGENVADSGIELAYAAFLKTKDTQSFGDFTAEQLFFVTNAQVWCQKVKDSVAITLLKKDPHSPSKARVTGQLMHSKSFAKAFNCPVNSPMNPAKKCNWWGK